MPVSKYRILGKKIQHQKNASIPLILDYDFQERTPGVGMEEDGDRGREERSKLEEERDGGREERSKLEERMSAIEADLDKACQEEDYDKAGESAILAA